jgi:hypothetical protein
MPLLSCLMVEVFSCIWLVQRCRFWVVRFICQFRLLQRAQSRFQLLSLPSQYMNLLVCRPLSVGVSASGDAGDASPAIYNLPGTKYPTYPQSLSNLLIIRLFQLMWLQVAIHRLLANLRTSILGTNVYICCRLAV